MSLLPNISGSSIATATYAVVSQVTALKNGNIGVVSFLAASVAGAVYSIVQARNNIASLCIPPNDMLPVENCSKRDRNSDKKVSEPVVDTSREDLEELARRTQGQKSSPQTEKRENHVKRTHTAGERSQLALPALERASTHIGSNHIPTPPKRTPPATRKTRNMEGFGERTFADVVKNMPDVEHSSSQPKPSSRWSHLQFPAFSLFSSEKRQGAKASGPFEEYQLFDGISPINRLIQPK